MGERTTFDPRKRPTAPPRPIGKEGIHLKASSGNQCGVSTLDKRPSFDYDVVLTCQRSKAHAGCHLDVENDTWFDYYEGQWVIMYRSELSDESERGRKAPTRKGV